MESFCEIRYGEGNVPVRNLRVQGKSIGDYRAAAGALSSRRAQVWSMDYLIGLLLFIFTLLMVMGTLFSVVLIKDTFSDVERSAEAVSEQLMSTGYPVSWRADSVISAGLLTQNGLSMRKAERLATISAVAYSESKGLLNTKYEYAITFQERNGSYVPLRDACMIGSGDANEQKSVAATLLRVAYYSPAGGEPLEAALAALNASPFSAMNLTALLDTLSDFDIVVLEQPDISSVTPPYDAQKAAALTDYVACGGTLFLIGDVNLTELFSLNITPLNATANATGQPVNDTLLNFTSHSIDEIPAGAFALKRGDQERYEPLAVIEDDPYGRDLAARFSYGDGDVYYLGTLDAMINETGDTLPVHISQQFNTTFFVQQAECLGVTLPEDVKHLVTVRRLVASEGRILVMRVAVWET